jgi:diguanylate cyclase (GGDEF)-like protein/PAS domain S-box-containing protein
LVGVEAARILGETHWQENLQKEFKAAIGGEIRNFQEWRDTPKGRRFFNVIYSPLREHGTITGVVVSAHDITELDDARMRLRRAARVFSDSSEAMIFIRVDGVIQDANAALASISGHDISALKGKSAAMLLSERNPADRWAEVLASLKNTSRWKGEVWLQHKDGHDIPGLLTVSAVPSESGASSGEDGGYTAVFTDISDLKANEDTLRQLANHDVLTGLPNRHQMIGIIDRNVELARRNDSVFTVMFIDLDHFKDVNDTLGHSAGDKLLQQAASRLRGVLRSNDVLARVGGDEFIAVFPGIDNGGNAAIIADKVIATMAKPFILDANTARVTASIGIASYPDDGEDREALLRNADTAMYQAKADGRSAWRCYSDEMTQRAARHLFLVSGLRQALANGDLRMVYQPEYDLQSGAVTGFEALLRWHHPDVGEIGPKEFIAAAEESSLIQALDLWAIERVCKDISTYWRDAKPGTRFAINISGMTLSMDKFVDKLREALTCYQVPGDMIELEVSEYALLHEMDSGRLSLEARKDLGVGLVIDDFGTGYSNLLYLRRLPIRQLKIDGAFVRELPRDPDGATITNAIIALGRSLHLDVVAAGVETEEQALCLREHTGIRCQGYLYSRPVEADHITDFLD